MFEIDLLKGKGRPIKSQPWAVVIAASPFVVLLIAAIIMLAGYVAQGIEMRTVEGNIIKADAELAKLSVNRLNRDKAQSDIAAMAKCTADVAIAVRGHVQWMDILNEISKNVPENVVLYKLSAMRERNVQVATSQTVKGQDSFKFKLMIGAYDLGGPGGSSIRRFIDSLKSSKTLGARLESIRPVSNQNGKFGERDVTVFDIECIFKAN
jgi:hypothetical protein